MVSKFTCSIQRACRSCRFVTSPLASMAPREEISPPPIKRRRLSNKGPADEESTNAERSHLTIYSWNVNGIDPLVQRPITTFFSPASSARGTKGSTTSTGLRDTLRRYSWPTMFFLQEVKIPPDDTSTMRAVERAIQPSVDESPRSPSYKAFFCLPRDEHNARGFGHKVYGVCSIIRQDFVDTHVERMREVEWDLEGRFLVCETKPVGTMPKLAIFNLYAVNGTDAHYKSPSTGKPFGTRHDRKLQVHRLLQAECQTLLSRGFQIVLAGDFNIARTTLDGHPNLRTFPRQHCINRADFEARFFDGDTTLADDSLGAEGHGGGEGEKGLRMIDSFRHVHGDKVGYTYYPRGKEFGTSCDRVDMILVSNSLMERLTQAGIHETPADRGPSPSDHVPLYITLLAH